MLSQHERRQLDEIERGLTAQYPALGARLRGDLLHRYRWVVEGLWVLGLFSFVLGVVTDSGELGMIGLVFFVAGLLLRFRRPLLDLFTG